jgi:hypothetical protein
MNDLWARLTIAIPKNHAVLVKMEFYNRHPCENSGLPARLRELDSLTDQSQHSAKLGGARLSAPSRPFYGEIYLDGRISRK